MLSHPKLLSHTRTLKPSKGHLTHNTGKRPCTSWPIKCILLQNAPETSVPPQLCPRQAAAQAHCGLRCGVWHGQAGTELKARAGEQRAASPGEQYKSQNIISYRGGVSVSACTGQAKEQPRRCWLSSLSPARRPVTPHTSLLTARAIQKAVCFPLWPPQHWT